MEKVVVKDIGCILNYSDDYAWQGRILIYKDNTFEGIIYDKNKSYITGKIEDGRVSFDLIKKDGKDNIIVSHVDNHELSDTYKGNYLDSKNHNYGCDIYTHRSFLDKERLDNLILCTKQRKKTFIQK